MVNSRVYRLENKKRILEVSLIPTLLEYNSCTSALL